MDLNTLRIFCDVVRYGTFSAAAHERGVSPSNVSRNIGALERELGVRLFQRTTRKMALTEAGQSYYKRIFPLLEELDAASQQVRDDISETPTGLLRVASPLAFAHEYVVGWVESLRERYPALQIELVLDARMSDLVDEEIDVAIRMGRLKPSSLIALRLCPMPRVVVGSPAYLKRRGVPTDPTQLCAHDCLVFPFEGMGTSWSFRDREGALTLVEVVPSVVIPEGLILRQLVVHGLGLSLLPRWLVTQELQQGQMVELFSDYDVTATSHDASIWLVYPSRDYLPLKVRVFLDEVKLHFREGPPWQRPYELRESLLQK